MEMIHSRKMGAAVHRRGSAVCRVDNHCNQRPQHDGDQCSATRASTRADPFAISLAYVLNDLVENTRSSKGRDYHDICPFPSAFACDHAACSSTNLNLTAADCSGCLLAAIAQLNAGCSMKIGARAILADCIIRYEQYPFAD